MAWEAVIAIGTNIGNREENLRRAVDAIRHLPRVTVKKCSSVYETEPVGYDDQANFYNMAVLVETETSPAVLLGECLGIEAAFGRERTIRNGPRILDLDLILYEGFKSESYEMTLPHPRMLERAFVMVPLLELYPSGRAPGVFFGPHLKEIGTEGVFKTDISIT